MPFCRCNCGPAPNDIHTALHTMVTLVHSTSLTLHYTTPLALCCDRAAYVLPTMCLRAAVHHSPLMQPWLLMTSMAVCVEGMSVVMGTIRDELPLEIGDFLCKQAQIGNFLRGLRMRPSTPPESAPCGRARSTA